MKKENDNGLDASFIISQTKNRNRPPACDTLENTTEGQTENDKKVINNTEPVENRRRRGKAVDYENIFIRNVQSNSKTRNSKTVYIRKEYHDRIMKIVQVIGSNEITLFNYIDNVLEHHFNTYQEDISELYKKRNTDIF